MDKSSRRDQLRVTIEQQNEELTKYKTKLRDVIVAYKSALKEKEALETTLKSLTTSSTPAAKQPKGDPDSEKSTGSGHKVASGADGKEQGEEHGTEDGALISQLREQIGTLTQALSTLTEERSRSGANFLADKKKILQEKEVLETKLAAETEQKKAKEKEHQEELQASKQRIRNLQHEREKDQNDHQIVLRELQKLVTTERSSREQLEVQLEELQLKYALRDSQPDRSEEYEKKIEGLSKQVELLRTKLKSTEEKASQPSTKMVEVQKELDTLKEQHWSRINEEQKRASDAEQHLQNLRHVTEERVTSLEARLSELSESVGTYDRQHQQDQQTIQRLKDRISQLEIENTALARAASCVSQRDNWIDKDVDLSNFDPEDIRDRILKMKELLHSANERIEKPLHLDGLLNEHTSSENLHMQCKQELRLLKEEFERYKMRAQTVLKNKKKDNETENEIETLRGHVNEMREKIRELRDELEDSDQKHQRIVSSLHASIAEMKSSHKQQLVLTEAEWQNKVAELEHQTQRQRERSFSLLEEKDKEIFVLKTQLGIGGSHLFRKEESKRRPSADSKSSSIPHECPTDSGMIEVATELSKLVTSDKKEAQFLHYMQELARKDVEIANLRKAKYQLEQSMRDLQDKFLMKEEKLTDEIELLNEKVRRYDRANMRDVSNLEYLKNVVLSYMLSSSASSRQHMLNAIAAILKFTAKELESVKQYNSTWWWTPATQ